MSNDFYSIEINNNNNQILANLNYYLLSNNHFEDRKSFALDQSVLVAEKENMYLLFSKEDVHFYYEEGEIVVKYDRARSPRNYMSSEVRFDRVTICSNRSLNHLLEFLKMIDQINVPNISDNLLTKYIWDKEGWRYNKNFKHRSLDTIYVPQKDKIVHTLDMFLNDSKKHELYSRLEIPAKKVFLFHGLPGTGKTSLIRALASHFKHNICVVKNVMDNDDNSLEKILSTIKKNSFLVFEDIDCIYKKGGDMGSNSSMSYSGILNMLDGIAKYDKLAIFITTNRINTLDATFKRRVDLFVEFTYVQKNEILLMYDKFFESETEARKFYDSVKNKKLTTNMLEKFFIYCIENEYKPIDHLKYLEEYAEMSSDRNNQNLYL